MQWDMRYDGDINTYQWDVKAAYMMFLGVSEDRPYRNLWPYFHGENDDTPLNFTYPIFRRFWTW